MSSLCIHRPNVKPKRTVTASLVRETPMQRLAVTLLACTVAQMTAKALKLTKNTYKSSTRMGHHPRNEQDCTTRQHGSGEEYQIDTTDIWLAARR